MHVEQKKSNNSFLIQGMILAGAGILTRLIGIAYRIPVNNILGDEGQGFYGCAFSIYNIALLLTSYSLPLAVSKLVSARVSKGEYKNAHRILKGALMFALLVGAAVGILVFCFSDFIAGSIMSLKLSVYALRVLAPGLFIVAVMGVFRGYFQGMGTMIPTAVSQILEQIVNAIVSIIGASYLLEMGRKVAEGEANSSLPYAYGAAGGTLGTVLGALTGLIFLLVLMKLYYPRMKRQLSRDLTSQTESYKTIYAVLFFTIAPVILSTAINNVNDALDQGIFSSIMLSQGYTEKETTSFLGMFTGKYNTLIYIPVTVANALGASMIPSLVMTASNEAAKEVKQKISLGIRLVMLIAIPSAVAFMAMPHQILSLLYVGNIDIPATMLRVGAITVIFNCFAAVTNAIFQGLNRMMVPVKHGAIALAIHVVSLLLLLAGFRLGVYALIGGNLIFAIAMCILNGRGMQKEFGYRQEMKKTFFLPGLASALMGLSIIILWNASALFIPDKLATVITIFVAILVYVVSLLRMGAMDAEEMSAMPKGTKLLTLCRKLHLMKEETK